MNLHIDKRKDLLKDFYLQNQSLHCCSFCWSGSGWLTKMSNKKCLSHAVEPVKHWTFELQHPSYLRLHYGDIAKFSWGYVMVCTSPVQMILDKY